MRSRGRIQALKSQRSRVALLALTLLVPIACAQGVQDTPAGDDATSGTGNDAGTGGANAGSNSAGKSGGGASGAHAAGAPGAGAGGKGGASGGGAAGKGGAGAGGAGGKGGAGNGGTANGGAPGAGAPGAGAPGAGAPGAGAPGAGAGGGPTVAGFSVQFKNEHTATSSAYLGGEILVKNAGPNSLGVSDIKVRYYFTDEVKKQNQFNNNFQHINTSSGQANLTVTFKVAGMAPTTATADTYIEFSFASDHGSLGPNEALDFAWQMQGPNPATDTFNQANDYSFDASKTSLTNWEHIVALQGTNLLWGTPP